MSAAKKCSPHAGMEGPHPAAYASHPCEPSNQDTTDDTHRQCVPRKILNMQEIANICINHNYSIDVVIRLFSLFGEELLRFLKCTKSPRELTIMVNSFKTDSNKVMDMFVNQEVDVEMVSWPYLLVAKKKPRELDLEAAIEHRAGYYMLQIETWSSFPCHKLPEWLMPAEAKTLDPPAAMRQPFNKDAVPAEPIKQDQTITMKWPLCQQPADTKTQDPVATKIQQFKPSDTIRHEEQCLEYVPRTLDNIAKTKRGHKPNKLGVCQLVNHSHKPVLALPQKMEKKDTPSSNIDGRGKIWGYTKKPKPQWLRKAEILWFTGFDLGARTVRYTPYTWKLGIRMATKIWLEYKRCNRRVCLWISKTNEIREYSWSNILFYQKWKDGVNFLKTNRDPRIPRFIGAMVSTKPKIKPVSRPEELQNCCMFYGGQGSSGMLPVWALAPFEGAHVLDLCASAGHHSILIGMLLQNTGVIVSNALIADHLPGLWANLHCFCVSNVIITHLLNKFPQAMLDKFSHVLVDAPCSGTGFIRKDERGDQQINDLKQIQMCTKLQQVLILSAVDSLSVGGHLVYSTSSVLVEENEAVVSYALQHRNIKLVRINLPFGKPGLINYRDYRFKKSLKKCRRVYPHHYKTEGIFLAKIRKL